MELQLLKAVKFKVNLAQQKFKEAVLRKDWSLATKMLKHGNVNLEYPYPPFGNTLFLDLVELMASQKITDDQALNYIVAQGANVHALNIIGNNAAFLAAAFQDKKLLTKLRKLKVDFKHLNCDDLSAETLLNFKKPKLLANKLDKKALKS